MGTRGILMVKSNGEYKVAQYSQWDNYPSGSGFKTIDFINDPFFTTSLFKEKVDNLTQWTDNELDELDKKIENGELNNWKSSYPELSRDTGSDIFNLIYNDKVKKVKLDTNFAKDSLFCEWGWCINLDTNCLDCFKGFQEEPLSEDQPFHYIQASMGERDYIYPFGYYPIKLICSIPFNELSEFIDGKDFERYIEDILTGNNKIMDNGIPKNWEENI